MKYTLLEMTQDILSNMDGDEVNSINDTAEALQVSRIIRQAYFDLIEDLNPPEHYSMFQLDPSLSASQPTLMTVPDTVSSLLWVKYNRADIDDTIPRYEEINFLPMAEFLNRMYQWNTAETYINSFNITVGTDDIAVNYFNDRAPTYYTTFGDDSTVLFDSYDSAVDTTLQKTKTICYGKRIIAFNLNNSFVPDLDEEQFSRLLNEAKVLAFAELKSVEHPIANRNASRSRTRSYNRKFKIKRESDFEQLPNYGRIR